MRVFFLIIFSLFLSQSLLFSSCKARYPFAQKFPYKSSVDLSSNLDKVAIKRVAKYYVLFKKSYFVKDGKFYRVANDKEDRKYTVSEGQGYGMIIVALMAGYDSSAKEIFDGMFAFAKAHPSSQCGRFMTWKVPAKKGDSDSAFDGDADIAYALLLASKQWGDSGEINYKDEAIKIIKALMNHTIGRDSHLPLLGDWVEQDAKRYNQFTVRTSDFMLGHFRAFYRVTKDKRWLSVIKASQRALIDIQILNKSSLVSDFIYFDKKSGSFRPTKKNFLEEKDDSFYYNACRVPFRVAVDALINGDKTSKKIALQMTKWIYKNSSSDPKKIRPGYHLDGKPIATDYVTSLFIAPFGVSSKLDIHYQQYLDEIFEISSTSFENYFEDSITLLSMLVMIDAFWDPTLVK